jgi:hypothetical protein
LRGDGCSDWAGAHLVDAVVEARNVLQVEEGLGEISTRNVFFSRSKSELKSMRKNPAGRLRLSSWMMLFSVEDDRHRELERHPGFLATDVPSRRNPAVISA